MFKTNQLVMLAVMVIVGGCSQTSQSVGTSFYQSAVVACTSDKLISDPRCFSHHPSYSSFTAAEKALVAFIELTNSRIARNEITTEQGQYLIAEYYYRAKAVGDESERQQAAAQAAALNATAASLNATAATLAAARPQPVYAPPPPPMPVQTRCYKTGMYVNCTSY